jgi:hypothetical protein
LKKQVDSNYIPKTLVGKMGKTICVNFCAGAGARKSTVASLLHGFLKLHGITSEYTAEYAKDLAWEGRLDLKINDIKIFGEQHNRQFRLNGKVDCIISDSPLFLSSVYRGQDSLMDALVMREYHKYDNINFYLKRPEKYIRRGRKENREGAVEIDNKVLELLNNKAIPYTTIQGTVDGVNTVLKIILERLNVKQLYKMQAL